MPRLRTSLLLTALAVLVGGCNIERSGDPFDQENPLRVEPSLAAAIMVTGGIVGKTFDVLGIDGRPPPSEYASILANENASPDLQRVAIDGLVDRRGGRDESYKTLYAIIGSDENEDELVRSSAVRALRRAGAADRTSTFVELLDADPTPVRLEAAKALAFLPDESALSRLLAIAEDAQEDQDVRIAAISALRHYRQTEVVERLVVLLDADPFSLAFQARTALVFMFGTDRGYKADRWLELAEGRVASERAS